MIVNVPQLKRLKAAFPTVEEKDLVLLRRIIKGELSPRKVPAVDAWFKQCYHKPKRLEMLLAAADALLGGHGVEAVYHGGLQDNGVAAEYINTGDGYNPTLIYDHRKGEVVISDYNSFIERNPSLLGD